MESAPGVVGRNQANIPRSRDFTGGVPLNGVESDRPSHTAGFGNAAPWGSNIGSIWNNNTLGTGFASNARESSRPRENSTYIGAPSDLIEGKTGSGSLVASSETDSWNINRTPWGDNPTSSIPHVRSSGVSPARKRSVAQAQSSQQYVESSPATYFPPPRAASISQGPVTKPNKPLLDPTTMNFTSARHVDPLTTSGFSSFGFSQADANHQRSEASVGSWPDAASVHSPSDDRRSVGASEYFGPSSAAQSRSGSLPPSRHGAEPLQYNQNLDQYSRYVQTGPRQHSSFSHANGRAFQERSGSIQSDSLQMLGRLSFDHEPDSSMMAHKPSMSINGLPHQFASNGNELGYSHDTYPDTQASARPEEVAYGNAGSFTPDSYANGPLVDPNIQFRAFQFDSRSAPNGTAVRQSPFYSNAHTPPIYDRLNPAQATLSNGNNIALVQSKLQGYQLQQERQTFINPSQFHQQQYQHILANTQLRTPYSYPYVPNGMHLNGMHSTLSMPVIPGALPMIEPPKAPRDHHHQPEVTTMSKCMFEFKRDSKQNKRYELKDIYDHLVEFSGDQHGSRFVQQKLETANSDDKERVFKELQGNALQLMQDIFGNYVIQKFFEHGDQTQKRILANRMRGHVFELSLQMYGCRVVQKALEHVLTDQQAILVKELGKDVLKAVRDQNGNHVIQKAIERVPMEHIQFIIESFRTHVGGLAVHPYGCRVIQRLLEHCEEPARRFIMQELHTEGSKLIADQYGNYVTQHVIEHGEPEDRAKMIALVTEKLLVYSKHKFASNVVEKCLVFGNDEQRREIMLTATATNDRGESNLMGLIKDGYGNYVIQKIMDTLCRKDYEELVATLKPEIEKAKKLVPGKQITAVEKKLHRFDRIDSVSSTQRTSIGCPVNGPPTPPLTSDAQSPQSSSLPSASNSTIDEPVHTSLSTNKDLPTPSGVISIEAAS
ncbi:ARM repeat-containing protein [Melanomma pulvis-pyrius CBS 109.77]|uniref:Pumilio homology domain family member 3 n=1 Tax=Melanomma pulvis-pyrius CBS 109.77 TaxID=1314802 RepID=A0A6A6X635_9PLEO|nr:ARM repeat-containing protein [Melanomma pulvis-pyrius CBS 109.77]